jgi:hypothetical protein
MDYAEMDLPGASAPAWTSVSYSSATITHRVKRA